ncbi:hypothetical protein [Chitinophaga filiformis]|uniref:DKNYY family protein n=1 Tax=Chitinophaga filiformis TaxID=104663 RepID=A0A1G7TSG9_CHIFI|nr:hypothetical protein [Chitinophaga filiformis]SDG37609.1 hypothetical protein SAMN04488121_10447 [Chitinophaga filiformis]
MRKLLTTLLSFVLSCAFLYGQSGTHQRVPDSVSRYIISHVSAAILQYRVDYNPELTEADKIYKKIGNQTIYKDAAWILFEDPEVYDAPELLMHVDRWPEANPLAHYYIVTKWENRFVLNYSFRPYNGKLTDTLYSKKYDSNNKYFPSDGRFLVYYDEQKGIFRYLSGNFFQDRINGSWYIYGTAMIPEIRLTQYAVRPAESFLRKGDTTIYKMPGSRAITHGSPGRFLVKTIEQFPYDYVEVIYYSNKVSETGDNDVHHFYEIKQIRDYTRGYPVTREVMKPVVRFVDEKEMEVLEKYYREPVYNFGNIDPAGMPVKK